LKSEGKGKGKGKGKFKGVEEGDGGRRRGQRSARTCCPSAPLDVDHPDSREQAVPVCYDKLLRDAELEAAKTDLDCCF